MGGMSKALGGRRSGIIGNRTYLGQLRYDPPEDRISFPTPRSAVKPRDALAHRLALMTEMASQHHVAWIEWGTTIVELDDVVAVYATLRSRHIGRVIGIVTSIATIMFNHSDQLLPFGREIERLGLLRWQCDLGLARA